MDPSRYFLAEFPLVVKRIYSCHCENNVLMCHLCSILQFTTAAGHAISVRVPDVSKYMIEFTYGDIYTRPGLDNKQRALITISSLVTQGTEPQLELHINAALTVGLTPEEIMETFIQLLSYTGFPRVLNAIEVARKVFAQRGVTVSIPEQDDLI